MNERYEQSRSPSNGPAYESMPDVISLNRYARRSRSSSTAADHAGTAGGARRGWSPGPRSGPAAGENGGGTRDPVLDRSCSLSRVVLFLADSPGEPREKLRRVAAWMVEDLADCCIIWEGEGEEIREIARASRRGGGTVPGQTPGSALALTRMGREGLASRATSSLETRLLFRDGGRVRVFPPGVDGSGRRRGRLDGIVAPMRLGDSAVGALGLFGSGVGPGWSSSEIGTAEELASLMALVVDSGDRIRQIVAHDVRGHLTSLAMLFEAYEGSGRPVDPPAEGTWRRARCSYEQIARLAEDLATDGQSLSVRLTSLDVGAVVESVHDMHEPAASREGVDLRMDVEGDPLRVRGDRARLVQCLSNLVQNAIKFTPAGGEVVIRARSRGGRVTITVSDSGPGIPAGERSRIFEPYWRGDDRSRTQGRTQGRGLGLAIARECVEAQDGRLRVSGDGGQGASFSVELPAASARGEKGGSGRDHGSRRGNTPGRSGGR